MLSHRLARIALALAGLGAHHMTHHVTVAQPVRITHAALVRWTRVAHCEESGWHNADGPLYFGALGWLLSTWQQFKRADFPANPFYATVAEQVWAAQRFAGYYHLVPDQHGCTGGY